MGRFLINTLNYTRVLDTININFIFTRKIMEEFKKYLADLKESLIKIDEVAYETRRKIYDLEEKIWKEEYKHLFKQIDQEKVG